MNKSIITQINSSILYNMYIMQFLELASNVWIFENLPKNLDILYINNILTTKGAIAFFYEEALEQLVALPFVNIGRKKIQNEYKKIKVYSEETGYNRILNEGEFIIIWDNTLKISIFPWVINYAKQYSIYTQVKNINIIQQKTPRIFKVPQNKENSFKKIINDIDTNVEALYTYEDIDIEDLEACIKPADFVADKIEIERQNLYNEFLRVIGITNLDIQKKERLISDEVRNSLGGAIACRFNRFTPRKQAIDLINEKFKTYLENPIIVKYYDDIPSSSDKKRRI